MREVSSFKTSSVTNQNHSSQKVNIFPVFPLVFCISWSKGQGYSISFRKDTQVVFMKAHGWQCPAQPVVVAVTAGALPCPSLSHFSCPSVCQCEPLEWHGRSLQEWGGGGAEHSQKWCQQSTEQLILPLEAATSVVDSHGSPKYQLFRLIKGQIIVDLPRGQR